MRIAKRKMKSTIEKKAAEKNVNLLAIFGDNGNDIKRILDEIDILAMIFLPITRVWP